MKSFIIISGLLAVVFNLFSQEPGAFTHQQQQLYEQLKACNYIETEYKGYQSADTSVVWQKADDFFEGLSLKNILSCFNDSSHTIRYYAFLKLLPADDSLAFEKLSGSANDSTKILFWFNNAGGEKSFNRLLADEYNKFIELKYHRGGTVTLADRHYLGENTYYFRKFSAEVWKQKTKQFAKLANLYGLNKMNTEQTYTF